MADSVAFEKLQPCLLDRLTDDDPKSSQETRAQRVISLQRYRQSVLRDLEWLFGASAHLPHEGHDSFSIEDFPDACKSVINYGVRHLFGRTTPNTSEVQRSLTEALYLFEPRIIDNTLKVVVKLKGNQITLDIQADLWASPFPEHLHLKTKLDLESGQCAVIG